MTEIELRTSATNATLAEYKDKPFDWAEASCIHLIKTHAGRMGHTVPDVPRFKTAIGAKRALTRMGFKTLPDLMDSLFERIAPAFMRTGDVMALEGTEGFEGLIVRAATNKYAGWHKDAPGLTLIDADMREAIGAWRL